MNTKTKSEYERLLPLLDRAQLPQHIAIIMDGNGRWAKQHGFVSRIRGHRVGIESVRLITRACARLGIKVLTLYAFSKENWQRPRTEISALMRLLETYLRKELPEMRANNIRLMAIGSLDDLPDRTRAVLRDSIEKTASHTGMILNLALSYGARTEIVDATKTIIRDVALGRIRPDELSPERFASYLYAPHLPNPDLLIRTSGEMRISNFLLWQIAYAELYVTKTLWPDFREAELLHALLDYQKRERRFGKIFE
jgi:undecaprenyl diphosphate synthase